MSAVQSLVLLIFDPAKNKVTRRKTESTSERRCWVHNFNHLAAHPQSNVKENGEGEAGEDGGENVTVHTA